MNYIAHSYKQILKSHKKKKVLQLQIWKAKVLSLKSKIQTKVEQAAVDTKTGRLVDKSGS